MKPPSILGIERLGDLNITYPNMSDKILVYSFLRCPFAMRVRITLHEKQIPFEVQEEDLKNFSERLRQIHPEAKVPVLVHGENVIYESAVITEYVEDAFPQKPLMPAAAHHRAEVRLWTYWCNQIFKPSLDKFKYGESRFPKAECEGVEEKLMAHLKKLETHLSRHTWLVGEDFSLADIHVFPFVRQLLRVTPQPPFFLNYPSVNKWADGISQRDSFKRAMRKQ